MWVCLPLAELAVFPSVFLFRVYFPRDSGFGSVHITTDLKAGEERLGERVEGAPLGLRLVEVELASEELHAQQSEDDEEEEEQQQQRGDGLHGVQQRRHQVGQSGPVAGKGGNGTKARQQQVSDGRKTHKFRFIIRSDSARRVYYRVTLKILSSRTQRSTEMPSGGMISISTSTVSRMPPHTTKQSNRLKNATK